MLFLDIDDNFNVSSSEKLGRINCDFVWADTDGEMFCDGGKFNSFGVKFKVDDSVNVSKDCTISVDDYNRLCEYYKDRFPNK